jgi:hypothetical protein
MREYFKLEEQHGDTLLSLVRQTFVRSYCTIVVVLRSKALLTHVQSLRYISIHPRFFRYYWALKEYIL